MTRVIKLLVTLLVIGGAGLAMRPWMAQKLGGGTRAAYFAQSQSRGPRVLETLGPLPADLRESSGLAVSRTQRGVVWSHNDSGDGPMLYAIDLKGKLLAKVSVLNVMAIDWEDIALGPCPDDATPAQPCLYIADSGNNDRSRNVLTIYVVAEPPIRGADPARPIAVTARSFRYRYPDQPEDTEAIAVLPSGDVTIVTKGRTPRISFFGFAKADVVRAVRRGDVLTAASQGDTGIAPNQQLGRWVTSAAVSPDGATLAVRTYSEIFFYRWERGPQGIRWRDLRQPCFLGDLEPQGEAIDYLDDKTLIIGSETTRPRPGLLHRVQC